VSVRVLAAIRLGGTPSIEADLTPALASARPRAIATGHLGGLLLGQGKPRLAEAKRSPPFGGLTSVCPWRYSQRRGVIGHGVGALAGESVPTIMHAVIEGSVGRKGSGPRERKVVRFARTTVPFYSQFLSIADDLCATLALDPEEDLNLPGGARNDATAGRYHLAENATTRRGSPTRLSSTPGVPPRRRGDHGGRHDRRVQEQAHAAPTRQSLMGTEFPDVNEPAKEGWKR